MTRRANGEGSIYRTAAGQWKVSLSIRTAAGKRRRINRNARTKADAVAILAKLRNTDAAMFIDPERITLGQYLERWLTTHVAANRSASTAALYRSISDRHITPKLGGVGLRRLSTAIVQEFVDGMIAANTASRSRQLAFAILGKAMKHAVKVGLIPVDPTENVDKPAHRPKEIFPFTQDEAASIIAESAETRWHALYVLALTSGMRQGELFGLEWSEIDLPGRTVRIKQAAAEVGGRVSISKPKTENSVRTVEITELAAGALRTHRAILLREGNAGSKLVFPAPRGGLVARSTFRHRYWLRLLRHCSITPRGFHHTRHTYATLALGAGVPVHVVAKVLGHSKPSTTHDIYSHVLKQHQDQATAAMQRLFG